MMRVRHCTRKSGKNKIPADGIIEAKDRDKVSVEHANGGPHPARDAEDRFKLERGGGHAYVESEAADAEVEEQLNPLTGRSEFFLRGDVDLAGRDPEGFDNL